MTLKHFFDGDAFLSGFSFRDADTTDFVTRAWTGNHFPLGSYGNFVENRYVDA